MTTVPADKVKLLKLEVTAAFCEGSIIAQLRPLPFLTETDGEQQREDPGGGIRISKRPLTDLCCGKSAEAWV